MKKVLICLTLSGLLAVWFVPMTVSAVTCTGLAEGDCKTVSTCSWKGNACVEGTPSAPEVVKSGAELITLINTIGNWVFAGVLAVASLFLIYAGFMWITAGGDPQAATKARQMLTNALIGVVVALLARGLVQVIKSVVGG